MYGKVIEKPIVEKSSVLSMEEACRKNIYHGYVWLYLFKHAIIKRENLTFCADLKYAEDWLFILSYYKYAHKMAVMDTCFYTQAFREDSATNVQLGRKFIEDNFSMYSRTISVYADLPLVYRKFLLRMLSGINIWLVNNVVYKKKENECKKIYRQVWQDFRSCRFKYDAIVFAPVIVGKSLYGLLTRIYNWAHK